MGLGCKHQLYLELIHKAATTLGMTISRCIFWSQVDKVLQEGGRGEGDGKETEQRLLWDQKKTKAVVAVGGNAEGTKVTGFEST